jgi:hypothetical protein
MWRFTLALIIGGGFLVYFGFQEYKVSAGTSTDAVQTPLEALEQGNTPPNKYVKFGPHHRLYLDLVYEVSVPKGRSEPIASDTVNYIYYPIISKNHPFIQKLAQLPPDAQVPPIESFSVLVKSKKFGTYGSLPQDDKEEAEITGLIINEIEGVSSEDQALIRSRYPNIDFSKVYILEEGRTPSSGFKSFGMMAGGVVLALIGIALLFIRRK